MAQLRKKIIKKLSESRLVSSITKNPLFKRVHGEFGTI
jgi:hypothetical protein